MGQADPQDAGPEPALMGPDVLRDKLAAIVAREIKQFSQVVREQGLKPE